MNKGVISVLVAYLIWGFIHFTFMRCSMLRLRRL